MLSTLFDDNAGNFSGDVWVLSTGLDDAARAYLDARGVRYHIDGMLWAWEALNWKEIAKTELVPGGTWEEAFERYRNKRMSKLIFCDWFDSHGANYDSVAICDSDMYFQKDVNAVFSCAGNGKINYAKEDNPIVSGSGLWTKDFHYRRLLGDLDYRSGDREINIGFLVAAPERINHLFAEVKKKFLELPAELISQYKWHDQDICRLLRYEHPEIFATFRHGVIVHTCSGGLKRIEERRAGRFYDRETNDMPGIIHFGGRTWENFDSVAPAFTIESDRLFYTYLSDAARRKLGERFDEATARRLEKRVEDWEAAVEAEKEALDPDATTDSEMRDEHGNSAFTVVTETAKPEAAPEPERRVIWNAARRILPD